MISAHSRPHIIAGNDKRPQDGRSSKTPTDNLDAAVDELKRFAEQVSRLALQPCDSLELRQMRLEALSDLCIAARQLADDDTFRALFDMALLHASNRLYARKPAQAVSDVIAATSNAQPLHNSAGADI